MSHLCPHCGFNLKADARIERDGFLLDPRGAVAFGGLYLDDLTKQQAMILHSVAKAEGRPIRRDVVWRRVSESDGLWCRSKMNSAVSDTRRALVAAGAPDPIKITYGGLLRWEVPSTIPGPMEKEA